MKFICCAISFMLLASTVCSSFALAESVSIQAPEKPSPRIQYGIDRLASALKSGGYDVQPVGKLPDVGTRIEVRTSVAAGSTIVKERFTLDVGDNGLIRISGDDDSGTLYGCLELARRVQSDKKLPATSVTEDAPVMTMRGACIGMQKTYILPGRKVYEYPYTPELFPFFYDKAFWTEYLDFLADHRMNSLYLWNGQPFASLVKTPGYEYAQEVPDDVFAKNQEMYRWIAQESDKRGIWLVQMFYSIILPKPLAEKFNVETQLAAPTPFADDYMRKAIATFVKEYPSVGIMACMGEALQGIDNQKHWLCDIILPGVKDGMAMAGIKDEPPVVLRTHATDLRLYMADALKVYKNLYTEAKFNGESLTTWEPRGKRQQVHLDMSRLGSTHMINVHVLANLEPFRYGAQRFIKKSVQAGRDRLGAKGVHLYPLAYWSWPDSPDKTDKPLEQIERDWIWFDAWSRYAWNPDVDESVDHEYWVGRLSDMYGTKEAAEKILAAYNDSGECAPRLLRRFGITEGNRQTLSLGMTLDELVYPDKYKPFEELWESQSPPGERLQEYVDKEIAKQSHEGETPPQIVGEVLDFSKKAVDAIDAAAGSVSKNREEFDRLRNDVHCIRAMSQNYCAKVNAAIHVLTYAKTKDIAEIEAAEKDLAESLDHYRELTRLTENTYNFANTMQTSQRRIPVSGGNEGKPANYHWKQLLPIYENEMTEFRKRVATLKSGGSNVVDESTIKRLPKAVVRVLSKDAEAYEVTIGAAVFTDRPEAIGSVAPELSGLTGIRFPHEGASKGGYTPVEFETDEPVQVLIGYFQSNAKGWLQVPDLETDAMAIDRGDVEPAIQNAATITGLPAVNVHVMRFPKGRSKLQMRGSGSFVVLGVVPQSAAIAKRDAGRSGGK